MPIQYQVILNRLLFGISFFSVISLCFSFFFEFGLQIEPCMLCNWQRIAHFFILSFAIFGFLSSRKVFAIGLALILLLCETFLGTYHSLIQKGYFKEICRQEKIQSFEDFQKVLETKPTCKDKMTFLKIPIPTLNACFSFAIVIFVTYILYKHRNTKIKKKAPTN